MGLPIWRDPEEKTSAKTASYNDPTAASRSSIRRHPSVHGRRSTVRPRLARDSTVHPNTTSPQQSRDPRRGIRGVPRISTLLETSRRSAATSQPLPPPPPPPVPESRNYYTDGPSAHSAHQGELAFLENRARRLREETVRLRQLAADAQRRADAPARQRLADQAPVTLRASPEPIARAGRPQSRDGASSRRAPPTPPSDASDPDVDSLFMPEIIRRPGREPHPLSHSWRPDSPIDGLGDRNRSLTPVDNWEIMRSTITPDATLPSADSSFTSAAASHSFTSNPDTTGRESEGTSSSYNSQRDSIDDNQQDSISSVDPDDMICIEDEDGNIQDGSAAFAHDMYDFEVRTAEGRERIFHHEAASARDGNRFASRREGRRVDIGFRLIEEALLTEEGRERLSVIGQLDSRDDIRLFEQVVQGRRHGSAEITVDRMESIYDDEPPSPHPERYSHAANRGASEARTRVHDYFPQSPQPNPLGSHPNVESFTSRDGPTPHPVSPPTQRSTREVSEHLLSGSGDEGDLSAMRRVVERLARRDDVPDEWWTSIGLNLSRTQPRAVSPRVPTTEEILESWVPWSGNQRGGNSRL